MIRLIKLFCFLGIFLLFGAFYGYTVVLEPGTPLFHSQDMEKYAHIPIIVQERTTVEVLEEDLYRYVRHPLIRQFKIYKIKMPDNAEFWYSPAIKAVKDSRSKISYRYVSPVNYTLLSLIALGGFILALFRYFQKRRKSENIGFITVIAILLLHFAALFAIKQIAGATIFYPSDEIGYFEAAYGLAHWDLSGPWRYTIGLSLFYLPFIKISNATTFQDIEGIFTGFNSYLVVPGCLVLVWLLLLKLSRRPTACLLSMILIEFFAFFHQYRDFFYQNIYVCKSFFGIVPSDWHYFLHSKFLIYGIHAGSENLAALTMLGAALISLSSSRKLYFVFAMSALFGLACMIRLNNIFFAPLLVWLLWLNFRHKLCHERFYILKFAGIGILGFFLIFSAQLLVNRLHFGSVFVYPYILHDAAVYKGFIPSCFPGGFDFICKTMWGYLVLGATGMIFIRNRNLRISLILMTVPLILFFAGYPAMGAGSTRFIMCTYYGWVAAAGLCICHSHRKHDWRSLLWICGPVTAALLLTAPSNYRVPVIQPWGWEQYPWGKSLIAYCTLIIIAVSLLGIGYLLYPKRYRSAIFLLLFMTFFYSGMPRLMLLLLLGLSGWTIVEIGKAVIKEIKADR